VKKFPWLLLIVILIVGSFLFMLIESDYDNVQREKLLIIENEKADSVLHMRTFELGYRWGRTDMWGDSLERRLLEFEKWRFHEQQIIIKDNVFKIDTGAVMIIKPGIKYKLGDD